MAFPDATFEDLHLAATPLDRFPYHYQDGGEFPFQAVIAKPFFFLGQVFLRVPPQGGISADSSFTSILLCYPDEE